MAQKRVLMKGNEVIAEAALRAGCRNYFGYPITPQTEVMHYMAKKMVQIGGNFVKPKVKYQLLIWYMERQLREQEFLLHRLLREYH